MENMVLPDRFISTAPVSRLGTKFTIISDCLEIIANLSQVLSDLCYCKPIKLQSFKLYSDLKPILHSYNNLFHLTASPNLS